MIARGPAAGGLLAASWPVTRLDVGVFRVDRSDKGAPRVARLFSAARRSSRR